MEFFSTEGRRNETIMFEGGADTLRYFSKNRRKLGDTWEYAHKKITYVYNEYGFRTYKFKDVDWSKSIVMFGDSYAAGSSLAIEDTIATKLEKNLNVPVINLGLSGSAVDIACWNSLILHKHYPRPLGIVHIWAPWNRYTNFYNGRAQTFQPHDKKFISGVNWEQRSHLYIENERYIWGDEVPRYECSFFNPEFDSFDKDALKAHAFRVEGIDWMDRIDLARDLTHAGSKSAELAANIIAEKLDL